MSRPSTSVKWFKCLRIIELLIFTYVFLFILIYMEIKQKNGINIFIKCLI